MDNFDQLIASLTDPKPKPDLKSDLKKELEKAAAGFGMTVPELFAAAITGVTYGWLFWRAAKRGDVAKTIYWGVGMINLQATQRDQRLRAQLKSHR